MRANKRQCRGPHEPGCETTYGFVAESEDRLIGATSCGRGGKKTLLSREIRLRASLSARCPTACRAGVSSASEVRTASR